MKKLTLTFKYSLPPWLRKKKIPEGKNAEYELQVVCDLFNGYSDLEGVRKYAQGFRRKKVTIIQESA